MWNALLAGHAHHGAGGEGIESEEGTPGVICIAMSLGWQINSISGLQPDSLCQEECEAVSGFWLLNVTIEARPGPRREVQRV